MAADRYDKAANDRWLTAYRGTTVGLLSLILTVLGVLGLGLLSGQEEMRRQLANQNAQISAILVKIDANGNRINGIQSDVWRIQGQTNGIDGRLNRIEGAGAK